MMAQLSDTMAPELPCEHCRKPLEICVCALATPLKTKARLVVLQHPQEQDIALGSAPLLTAALPKAQVHIGLSWRSLEHALGETADVRRWAIMYPATLPRPLTEAEAQKPAILMDSRGRVSPPATARLHGVIVLDGTWSQAKSLWWRNAWMLKLPRLLLAPAQPSIYGRLRKEPKRGYVSTLEAGALALEALGEPQAHGQALRKTFRTMVQRARDFNRPAAAQGKQPS
jgi:hypothetical protein